MYIHGCLKELKIQFLRQQKPTPGGETIFKIAVDTLHHSCPINTRTQEELVAHYWTYLINYCKKLLKAMFSLDNKIVVWNQTNSFLTCFNSFPGRKKHLQNWNSRIKWWRSMLLRLKKYEGALVVKCNSICFCAVVTWKHRL